MASKYFRMGSDRGWVSAACVSLGLFVAVTASPNSAWAEEAPTAAAPAAAAPTEDHATHNHAAAVEDHAPASAQAHESSGHESPGHESPGHESPGHEASGHETTGHGHHASEPPQFSDINWAYGFFGEEEGAEPSFMVRPKGMGTPFLATLINWGILVGLIAWMAKKQLPAALAKRKAQIVQGMDDAAKMLAESKAKLEEFEVKLAQIDSEITRIKDEMARAGELERERILSEAVERRVRMERDAHRLLETELEAASASLRKFVLEKAMANAKDIIAKKVQADDQARFFDEALASLKKLPSRSFGGQL